MGHHLLWYINIYIYIYITWHTYVYHILCGKWMTSQTATQMVMQIRNFQVWTKKSLSTFYFQVFRDSGFHSGAKFDQERGGVHYYLQKLCPCRARGWDITLNSLEKQVAECRITNYWHEHEIWWRDMKVLLEGTSRPTERFLLPFKCRCV